MTLQYVIAHLITDRLHESAVWARKKSASESVLASLYHSFITKKIPISDAVALDSTKKIQNNPLFTFIKQVMAKLKPASFQS